MPRDIALGMMQHKLVRAYAQPPVLLVRSKNMSHTWDRRRKQRRRWIRLLDSNSRSKAENGEELGLLVLAVDLLAERHCIALWQCVSRRQHVNRMDHIAIIKRLKSDKDVIS